MAKRQIILAVAMILGCLAMLASGQGKADTMRDKLNHLARETCANLYDACYTFAVGITANEADRAMNTGPCSIYSLSNCADTVTNLYMCWNNCSATLCNEPDRLRKFKETHNIQDEETEEDDEDTVQFERIEIIKIIKYYASASDVKKSNRKVKINTDSGLDVGGSTTTTGGTTATTTTTTGTTAGTGGKRRIARRRKTPPRRLLQEPDYTAPTFITGFQESCLSLCDCGAGKVSPTVKNATANATTTKKVRAAAHDLTDEVERAVKALHGLI